MTRPRRRLRVYVSAGPVTTDSPSSLGQATSLPRAISAAPQTRTQRPFFHARGVKETTSPDRQRCPFLPRAPSSRSLATARPGAAVTASVTAYPARRPEQGEGSRSSRRPSCPASPAARRRPECQAGARAWPLRARGGSRPRRARPPGAAAASRSTGARAPSRPRPRALRGRRGQ